MTLVEAAYVVERLQGRAAHAVELEALRIARDAILVIVSEGFLTLKERLRTDSFAGATTSGLGADALDRQIEASSRD